MADDGEIQQPDAPAPQVRGPSSLLQFSTWHASCYEVYSTVSYPMLYVSSVEHRKTPDEQGQHFAITRLHDADWCQRVCSSESRSVLADI